MSKELRARGYVNARDKVRDIPIGLYEGFILGAKALDQLRQFGIVPDHSYDWHKDKKSDGLVVDRRGSTPSVKLVMEFKDCGHLDFAAQVQSFSEKVAGEYCRPLLCEIGGVSDRMRNS